MATSNSQPDNRQRRASDASSTTNGQRSTNGSNLKPPTILNNNKANSGVQIDREGEMADGS